MSARRDLPHEVVDGVVYVEEKCVTCSLPVWVAEDALGAARGVVAWPKCSLCVPRKAISKVRAPAEVTLRQGETLLLWPDRMTIRCENGTYRHPFCPPGHEVSSGRLPSPRTVSLRTRIPDTPRPA